MMMKKKFGYGAIIGTAMLFAGVAYAAELRDVTVESVDEDANTVTIQGVTYDLGDISTAGLQPGMQVHIWFEEEDGKNVLTEVEPEDN
jgi:hypothetical protein